MSTKTKIYSSTQLGAPVLSGSAGALIALLDAVLVNGWGSQSATSLVVAGGVATISFATAHSAQVGGVVMVAGATPSGLNGEKRVRSVAAQSFTFDATGVADSTATGTITSKVAAAGWTKLYTGTNMAAYKIASVEGTGFILRVDDTGTTVARVRGYESMSDVSTGTGLFPSVAQFSGSGLWWSKSNAASAAARPWHLVADDRGFYYFCKNADTASEYQDGYFGDILSTKSNDPYSCLLRAHSGDRSTSVGTVSDSLVSADSISAGTGMYIARAANALGSSVPMFNAPAITIGLPLSHVSGSVGWAYPAPVDNSLTLTPIVVYSTQGYRGYMPGVRASPQITHTSFSSGDRVSGSGDMVGKSVVVIKLGAPTAGPSQGVLFVEVLSDWREVSASRYWRLTGISTPGNSSLELSEVRISENGVLADTGASLSSTLPPSSGLISYLYDGLATNVVAWSHSKFNAPGFALVWDFGGAGVDAAEISFGTGADAGAFILDAAIQRSEDGFTWVTQAVVTGVKYPGDNVLTPSKPTLGGNLNFDSVVLQLSLTGSDGSTVVVDRSKSPKPLTCVGNAKISTAKPRFGRPSLAFDGSGDSLVSPSNSGFDFGTDPFTLELQLYANSLANSPMLYTRMDSAATADSGWFIEVAANTVYFGWGGVGSQYLTFSVSLTTGAWHHIAVTRVGNTLNCFVNGVSPGALTHPNAALSHDKAVQIALGGDLINFPALSLNGYMAEIRITRGIVVYTSNFTPPSSLLPLADGFLETEARARLRTGLLGSPQYAVGANIEDSAIRYRSHGGAFLDSYNGGSGMVVGTVKERSTPSNTPLRRRVLLIDEGSGIAIRKTWSDSATGNYEFRGVKEGVPYTVLSYDHTGAYRAVVADGQLAERMQ